LLQASIKGSSESFERLVSKYQSLVCSITYSATGDIEKSEELAQETFVRAWKNLAQLKDQTRFKFWLCSIAKSTIKNYFRYQMRGHFTKPGNDMFGDGKPTGSVEYDFTVGRIEGGVSDRPLDLGNIPAEVRKDLKLGDTAPDFEFKSIDGKIAKLSDYRGKFVLLDFWHRQWREDARVGLEEMGRIYQQFGGLDKLVIISVTSGSVTPPELMKQYIEYFNMEWISAVCRDEDEYYRVNKRYLSGVYPARFLVGPDAEVLGVNLKGKDLIETLNLISE